VAFRPYLNGWIFSLQRAITVAGSISDSVVFIAQRLPYTLTKQQKVPQLTQTVPENIQQHPN